MNLDKVYKQVNNLKSADYRYLLGALIVGTLIRIPQLFHSLFELHSFRQTQTAWTAREFLHSGIDVFNPQLPIFGADSVIPMEFPIYQAFVATMTQATGMPLEVSGRLLSLVFFQISAIIIFFLCRKWFGTKVSSVAILIYEFAPWGLNWGASFLIESMAVAMSLATVYFFTKWCAFPKTNLVLLTSGFAAMSALIKPTTTVVLLLLCLIPLIDRFRESGKDWFLGRHVLFLSFGLTTAAIPVVGWQVYSDVVKSDNYLGNWATSNLIPWYFGTLAQRADPNGYLVILERIQNLIAGPYCLSLFLILYLISISKNVQFRNRGLVLLASSVLGPLVFFNLYVVHVYYLSAIFPQLCILVALAIVKIATAFSRLGISNGVAPKGLIAGTLLVQLATTVTGVDASGYNATLTLVRNGPAPGEAAEIAALSKPGENVLTLDCGFDPTILYAANRRGMMLNSDNKPYLEEIWARNSVSDYSLIYVCEPKLKIADFLPAGKTFQKVSSQAYLLP